VVDIASNKLMF